MTVYTLAQLAIKLGFADSHPVSRAARKRAQTVCRQIERNTGKHILFSSGRGRPLMTSDAQLRHAMPELFDSDTTTAGIAQQLRQLKRRLKEVEARLFELESIV